MTTSSEIILLRCIDFQESSKIITALSREHGKIALIARGVRRPKNKLAGLIETGNILEVVYYYKTTRNVHTIKEAAVTYQSQSFRSNFEKAAVLYASLELVNQLAHENVVNLELFNFTNRLIQWLGDNDDITLLLFPYIQIRLAQLAGIGLMDECTGNNSTTTFLNISNGNISEDAESELAYRLTELQAQFLIKSLHSRRNDIFSLGMTDAELKQLIHHLDVYFKYHVEGYKERRSDAIFEQMI